MGPHDDDPLRVGGVPRPGAAAAVDGASPADAAAAVDGPQSVTTDGIDAVAASLSAGAIDAQGALAALIDATASSMLGPGADPAAVEAVRAEVAALLAGDPTLAALLRA